jgi:SNF2 family DNA or RNA helicase
MEITSIIEKVKQQIAGSELRYGEFIYINGDCTLLSQSVNSIEFMVAVNGGEKYSECVLILDNEEQIVPEIDGERTAWNRYSFACLLQYEAELKSLEPKEKIDHKKYTRPGMIKRVLNERQLKAERSIYRIKWASNIYGDHILTNETGARYKVFLRDFEHEIGYSDSADAKFNKLGTTKHIMYAFKQLRENKDLYERLDRTFPFIEIYCNPLNDYKISWYYPGELPIEEKLLISRFFKKETFIEDTEIESFLRFIDEAAQYNTICIRPEVREKVERRYEQLMLDELKEKWELDYSLIHTELFPYQKGGVNFAVFRKAVIIADEMGLGKTIQAIATAVLKKQIFGFSKTLIVCPATLKTQWKNEIEKFTGESALILSGLPKEREKQYLTNEHFFYIVNYETVLRDSQAMNKAGFDFLILDEAQKIKNYETKTSSAIKRLKVKHCLVITGTPIENRLIDIYSIINTIDPYFLGPLWEFSYQHCLFDPEKPNKINGYYDLHKLNEKLSGILIRREKHNVLSQLPSVQQRDILVKLSPLQQEYHGSYMAGVAKIIHKKFLTPYDLQNLTQLLNAARMVCDSTFLVDDETNDSPKLLELKDILFEKLDIQNTSRKVIVFSEWLKMHKLIGQMLRENKVGFVELNGKVPVALRGELIRKFENNADCKVFLSTEAGGAGLNLQMADILINFELPWNPAKKNQRIGRIDRLGQKSNKLLIYNLISPDSIEQQIAAGLLVKQSLFDGVLSDGNTVNYVDFSTKGRSQFIQQIETFVSQWETADETAEEAVPEETAGASSNNLKQLELFNEVAFEREETAFEEEQTPLAEMPANERQPAETPTVQAAELEEVMNSGMQFLSGLFKMSTGKDLGIGNQKIEIDPNSGEVVMRFKLKI